MTVETCPQYLVLNTDDLCRLKGFARCAPALRDQAEVDTIWSYVLDGTITSSPQTTARTQLHESRPGRTTSSKPRSVCQESRLCCLFFYDAAVNRRGMDQSRFVRDGHEPGADLRSLPA